MTRSKRRSRKNRRPNAKSHSIIGSILLELIAVVAFLIFINGSRTGSGHEDQPTNQLADRTAEYGSLFTGFLSDQIQQHGMLSAQ